MLDQPPSTTRQQIDALRQLFQNRRRTDTPRSGTSRKASLKGSKRSMLLSLAGGGFAETQWSDTQWSDTQWSDTRLDHVPSGD